MKKLQRSDLWPLPEYERMREEFRRSIIEYKKTRRVDVGDRVSLTFENRKTMKWQVMEMVRTEHLTDPSAIDAELAVYNELIPNEGELVATMFIAFSATDRVKVEMPDFLGLDRAVWLEVDGHEVRGEPEAGRAEEARISSVQYLRFRLDPAAREALRRAEAKARIALRHPSQTVSVEVSPAMRESLSEDLA